jgi:PAS domain-containing protein
MPASWRVAGDMPKYFFHLRIGASLELDENGLELPDSYQAYLEACRAMPRLAEEMLARGRDPLQCRFEIADAHDQRLFEIPFAELALELNSSALGPNFVSPQSRRRKAERIFRSAFAQAHFPCLVLTPDFVIAGANDPYAAATGVAQEAMMGRNLFEVFPDNPNDPAADGVRNLTASLKRVRALTRHDVMKLQRYDLRDKNGVWQEKYWHPANWPIVDDDGSILALIHQVTEVPMPDRTSYTPEGRRKA